MKKTIIGLFKLFVLINLLILALLAISEQASAKGDQAIWKHQATGNFTEVVNNIKAGLEGA